MADPVIDVLLVEDNRGDAVLITEALRDIAGTEFRVRHCERLQPALEILQSSIMDVMLLDLSLPDSQGLDTVSRATEAAPDLPIVVLTGDIRDAVAMEAVHLGAQDYLIKQEADSRQIARSIRYAMERKRAQVVVQHAKDELERRVRERTEELEHALVALREEFDSRIGIEMAMQDREEALHQIFQGLEEALWIATPDMQQAYCLNPACQRMFGLRAEEAVRQSQGWLERVHPQDRDAVGQAVSDWLAQRRSNRLKLQFRIVSPDGVTRLARVRFYAIANPVGDPTRVCVLAEDISDDSTQRMAG